MAIFPGAVSTDADLYIAVNNLSTLLTDNPLTVGATTVNVLSTTGFPTVGTISIDAEIIKYTGKTATSFTGCTRGFDGTTAASHLLNAQVDHNVVAIHHNAPKDEIIAIEQNLSDRIGLHATQLRAPDGSSGAPTYSFALDTNTGIRRGTTDDLRVVTGGSDAAIFDNTSFYIRDGVANSPGMTFIANQNTGIYRPTLNEIGFSANGVERVRVKSAGLEIRSGKIENLDGTNTAPTYSFANETGLGWYRGGSARMSLAFGTVEAAFFDGVTGVFGLKNNYNMQTNTGTVALPGYAFNGDPDTGLYSIGANEIGFSTGGVLRASLSTAAFNVEGSTRFFTPDGSASLPSHSFGGDQDTGLYRFGNNALSVAAGGAEYLRIGVTGASGAIHSPAVGGFSNTINSAGNVAIFYAENTDNSNGSSHAVFRMLTGGSASGDPKLSFEVSGITGWAAGIDNSDSDIFVIQDGANLSLGGTFALATPNKQIIGQDGTAANPYYSFYNDQDSGIYRNASNEITVSIGGIATLRVLPNNSANDIRLQVYDHTAGTLKTVSRGATDSGGTGFRVLRIVN